MILHLVECCIWQQRTGLPLNRRMTTAATWHACKMWHAYACLPDVILSNHAVLEAKRQSMPGCVMPAHSCRGETEITLAPQSHMYTHTPHSLCLSPAFSLSAIVCMFHLIQTVLLYQSCFSAAHHMFVVPALQVLLTALHCSPVSATIRLAYSPEMSCHSSYCASPNYVY